LEFLSWHIVKRPEQLQLEKRRIKYAVIEAFDFSIRQRNN